MEYLLKVFVLLVGANVVQDPKACSCSFESQSFKANKMIEIMVHERGKRCKLSINSRITITPVDDSKLFDQYTVSLHSSRHGLLSQQTINSTSFVQVKNDMNVGKHEKVWISVEASNSFDYLVSNEIIR